MIIGNISSSLPLTTAHPQIPPVKPPKKEKIKRIYEDNDFIIDLFVDEPMVRVSVFEDGHFKEEKFIKKDPDFKYGGTV